MQELRQALAQFLDQLRKQAEGQQPHRRARTATR